MKKFLVSLICLSILGVSFPFSVTNFESSKVKGMAGAYTAIAFDENAPQTNPAGLAFVNPGLIGHFNIDSTYEANDGTAKAYKAYRTCKDDASISKPFLNANFQNQLKVLTPFYSIGGQATYFTQDFAIGGQMMYAANQRFNNTGVEINQNMDCNVDYSTAFKFMPFWSFGSTIQLAQKINMITSGTWQDLDNVSNSFGLESVLTNGAGKVSSIYKINYIGANVGTMIKLGDFSVGYAVDNLWTSTKTWKEAHPVSGSYITDYNNLPNATDTENVGGILNPVQHIGIGYSDKTTLVDIDVTNPGDVSNQTIACGIQQRLISIPVLDWLGESIIRVGYKNGKTNNVAIEEAAVGTRLKVWLFTADITAMAKKVEEIQTSQIAASMQMTF